MAKRILLFIGCVLLASALIGGVLGYQLVRRTQQALVLTRPVQVAIERRDLAAACRALPPAQQAWQAAAAPAQWLSPLLRRLDWLPHYGADLALAPDLIALAHAGSSAGVRGCRVIEPALLAETMPQRLSALAEQLRQPAALEPIRQDLRQARQAWSNAEPRLARSVRLAPYRRQLQALGATLPPAEAALEAVQQLGPELPWLLGLDAPRRYLVISQNPFELRPTGGFIGLVCVLEVAAARPEVRDCQGSGHYDAQAPAEMLMPLPYTRYLRISRWTLRDANWSPDFPTSARMVRSFWELNGGASLDGVIAADPFAFVPLLRASGPLTLADGSQVAADRIVDTLLALYYDGEIFSDRRALGELLPRLVQHLQATPSARLPALGQALIEALRERHLLFWFDAPALEERLATYALDGAVRATAGDSLRIVEADVGYGDVNAFVERLAHYDITLSDDLRPLTATLTLTYTNYYSPWAEAPTSHAVTGRCTDPQTLELGAAEGCYANFLRVYVPRGSRLLTITGVEEPLGVDYEHDRFVFGGYLRIAPGEQRTVRIRYRLPELAPGTLQIEKQPGLVAMALRVTARTSRGQAQLWMHSRSDVILRYRDTDAGLRIEGPADPALAAAFTRAAALRDGLAQWQAGHRDAALRTWQAGAALDRVLDHARLLATRGQITAALELTRALLPLAPDGRAAFETAQLLDRQGAAAEADRLYRIAVERSPEHPLAQLTWVSRLAARAQPLPPLTQIDRLSPAVRRWRQEAEQMEHSGDPEGALARLALLHRIVPDDRLVAFRYAELLLKTGQRDLALQQYQALARTEDFWGLLSAGRSAQLTAQPATAIALYQRAIPLARNDQQALRLGHGLRDLGDIAGATQAYRRAAELNPTSIWPLLAAGNALRTSDPEAARQWFLRAAAVDPHSGYPDYALGQVRMAAGDVAGALTCFEAAVTKQPEVKAFAEALAKARAALPSAPVVGRSP